MKFVDGKKFFVLGLGLSGRAAVSLLAGEGRNVVAWDEDADAVTKHKDEIACERYRDRVEFPPAGADRSRVVPDITSSDVVVLSPGVPLDHPLVAAARDSNVAVVSEIEAAFHFTNARIIGVTGTNGKSTTVGVIGNILEAAGVRHVVAGNVGTPFAGVVGGGKDYDVIVLELSSFQLDTISEFRADVAVLLNVTPDHLDRYNNSMDEYAMSKARILNLADERSCFVFNENDDRCRVISRGYPGTLLPFSSASRPPGEAAVFQEENAIFRSWAGTRERVVERSEFTPVGIHNMENAMAAVGAASAMDVPLADIRGGLRSYRPLPHRMELVKVAGGVAYVNDSKATNVDATIKSLISIDGGVVLILGGKDKQGNFGALVPHLKNVRRIIVIGEATDKIMAALEGCCAMEKQTDMAAAVTAAANAALAGDTVLLAPACASFDMFDSYNHRGEVFRSCVNAL
jgi:UDP-N-acetylmuramoylalanine--D-glutamate ligase